MEHQDTGRIIGRALVTALVIFGAIAAAACEPQGQSAPAATPREASAQGVPPAAPPSSTPPAPSEPKTAPETPDQTTPQGAPDAPAEGADGAAGDGGGDVPPGAEAPPAGATKNLSTVRELKPRKIEPNSANDPQVQSYAWAKGIRYYIPLGWKREQPSTPMRIAQMRIKAPEGSGLADAIVTISGDIGGTAEANTNRWINQIKEHVIQPTRVVLYLDELVITQVQALGSFLSGLPGDPTTPTPDTLVLGAVVENGPEGAIYIKGVGPRQVLINERAKWDVLIRSLKVLPEPIRPRTP